VCGPGGVRCIGGVSSLQALVRNRRTCRSDTVLADGVGLPSRSVDEREIRKRENREW
jgi:hypothetical protein